MQRTILALAAVLATSGLAMAKDTHTTKPHTPAACSEMASGKLDCGATGSVRDDRGPLTTNSIRTSDKPRVGIDINPWIVPSFN